MIPIGGYPSIDKPWLKYYPTIRENDVEGSLYDYLWKKNKSYLEDIAICYFGKTISYKNFFRRIDAFAATFVEYGIKPKEKVVVLGMSTPDIICSIYALNKIGAIVCIEPVTQIENNLTQILQEYKAKSVVVLDVFYAKYKECFEKSNINNMFLTRISDSMPTVLKCLASAKNRKKYDSILIPMWKIKGNKTTKGYSWDENDTAILLSTSGSTGMPKRAELSCKAINSLAYQSQYYDLGFERGLKMLTPTPPFLAYGISLTIHMPLCNGICLVLVPNPDTDFVANQFLKYKPNLFITGSAFLDKIAEKVKNRKIDLSFLYAVEIGGHKVSGEYIESMEKMFAEHNGKAKVLTGYGMTELAGCSTSQTFSHAKKEDVGIPLCDVNMKVVDVESGEELTYGNEGELLISSPCMMNGYFNNADETKKAIVADSLGERWIRTGDLAKIDEDGFIFIVGRIKNIAVTRENESGPIIKLFTDYIEYLLDQNPYVEKCAVITVPDSQRLNVPVAYVMVHTGIDNIEDLLREYLYNRTEKCNVPSKFVILEEFPVLPNGKVDYKALKEMSTK